MSTSAVRHTGASSVVFNRLRMIKLAVVAALLAIAPLTAATAADSPVVKTAHLEAQLVAQTQAATPGATIYLAVRQKIAPGWHTYWRNPGDAGEATSLKWTLPPGWRAGEFVWPTPSLVMTGPLASYVYEDAVYLPVPVEVPASAKAGAPVTLKARAEFLVCKDICVPEGADLSITLPIAAGSSALDPKHGQAVSDTLAKAPKAAGLEGRFQAKAGAVVLSVTGAVLKGAKPSHAFFFPFDGSAIEHAKPERVQVGPNGVTFTLAPGFSFQHGAPKELAGVVALDANHAFEVAATPGAPLPGAAGANPPVASTPLGGHAETGGSGVAGKGGLAALAVAVGGALVGGLILNLMPCVFPVLAMKAAALARHVDNPAHARAEGLAFTAGVLATFVGLAALLLAAKAAGQSVGWGFQLQSPAVVAVLCLIMLLAALNLSGLFEAGVSLQGAGGALASKGGMAGSFFTGVLAVVVAAPCTAPFMAPAIGWAVTQPPAASLLVFAFLGLGLALPFTVVAFVPGLFKALPKPGAWMEGLRKFLAFPMYGTAAWLAWVFVLQAGDQALPWLFAAALAVAFGAWMWGVAQRREAMSTGGLLAPRLAAAVAVLLAVPAVVQGASLSAPTAPAAGSPAAATAGGALPIEAWSPARVAELQAQGRPVFVDFTAAWCVTCQVNEKTALAGKGVSDAFTRTNAVYLKADWTKRDPVIAEALSAQGRSGVPLYLVYGAAPQPQVLPQLLTEGAVVSALDAATKKPA